MVMPTREFSQAIVGPVWPSTPPDALWSASEAHAEHAQTARNAADDLYRAQRQVEADNSGQFADGYAQQIARHQADADAKARMHDAHSDALKQTGDAIHDAHGRLDDIDRQAHEQIQQARQAAQADPHLRAGLPAQLSAIITGAQGEAGAAAATTAALIGDIQAGVAAATATATSAAVNGAPVSTNGVTPMSMGTPGTHAPQSGGQPAPQRPTPGTMTGDTHSDDDSKPGPLDSDKPDGDKKPKGKGKDGDQPSATQQRGDTQPPAAVQPQPAPAAAAPPAASGGGVPASGLGDLGKAASSGAGGLPTPPSPPIPPTGGGPGTGIPAGSQNITPPPAMMPPPAVASGGGAPVAPAAPVASAPASSAPASSPLPRRDETPAPPAPAAPAPPAPAPVASSSSGPPVGAPMGGPLPPFTPDAPRTAAAAPPAPATTQAAPAAPPASPLPPGVLTAGVGAAASGSGASVTRSGTESPHLKAAARLVYDLMHASRAYGPIDWCAAVFTTPHGPRTVLASNEGAGYIPAGVFVPRDALLLFVDVSGAFRDSWFGCPNPAQTLLAYAHLLDDRDVNANLSAVAVSTDYGGSARPVRDAGVRHYEECLLSRSPIPADAPPTPLDGGTAHRLEAIDPAAWRRITNSAHRPTWPQTRQLVNAVLARCSELITLSVPPIIRHVTAALDTGDRLVTDKQWDELEEAANTAQLFSAAQRGSPYGRAHHDLARTAELLACWRTEEPLHPEIAYLHHQIEGIPT